MTRRKDDAPAEGGAGNAMSSPRRTAQGPSPDKQNNPGKRPPQAGPTMRCVTCGAPFAQVRTRHRQCLTCAQALRKGIEDLAKRRTQDGVTVEELRQNIDGLLRGDPAALAWLELKRMELGGGGG